MEINIQKRKLYCRLHPHGTCLRYVSGLSFNVSVDPPEFGLKQANGQQNYKQNLIAKL